MDTTSNMALRRHVTSGTVFVPVLTGLNLRTNIHATAVDIETISTETQTRGVNGRK